MFVEHLEFCEMSEYPLVKYLSILNIVKIISLHFIEENLKIGGKVTHSCCSSKLLLVLWFWIFPLLLGFSVMGTELDYVYSFISCFFHLFHRYLSMF